MHAVAVANPVYLDMAANRWKYFRWTPRTAWLTFVYVVAVPSAVGYMGFVTDVSHHIIAGLLAAVPLQTLEIRAY